MTNFTFQVDDRLVAFIDGLGGCKGGERLKKKSLRNLLNTCDFEKFILDLYFLE